AATLESGLGIQGTVESHYDQVDVWLYSAAAEYQRRALTAGVALVGQTDGLRGPGVRGNENLSELQAFLWMGGPRWARLAVVRGLAPFSPRLGAAVSLGVAFGIVCELDSGRPPRYIGARRTNLDLNRSTAVKSIVCIKRVPDTEARIKIADDGASIDAAGIKYVTNPYDEFAIEAALRLKEGAGAGDVTVVTVGDSAAGEQLRSALAMGADNAVLLKG